MTNWNSEVDKPADDGKEREMKMSELALEALTCTRLHLRAVSRFKQSMDIATKETNLENQAQMIAWEKASSTTLEMANKALQQMEQMDEKFNHMINHRWDDMEKLIESTIPMLKVMIEAELAEVPPIYKFVRDMNKEAGDNE